MRRFWTDVALDRGVILLDGRPVRTPARRPLVLPTPALAAAVADEWRAVVTEIDPRAMPLTGLANAAIDRIADDPDTFVAALARYAGSDLLCYRAQDPLELVARQAAAWDPLLDWARTRYDVGFAVTTGIVPVVQPAATVERLRTVLASLDPFRLAALHPIVTIAGSLVIGLALLDGAVPANEAFASARLDELWQAERWGEDALAAAERAACRRDWDAATTLLALL